MPNPSTDLIALAIERVGVESIGWQKLVQRAVINARSRNVGISTPRWNAICDAFALGSTYSRELCALCGVDPDEFVGGPVCETCEDNADQDDETPSGQD